MRYVSGADMDSENFQPMNANFGLLPPLPKPKKGKIRKKERRALYAKRALKDMEHFIEGLG